MAEFACFCAPRVRLQRVTLWPQVRSTKNGEGVILGGHVNPQYDYGFGRIPIKLHLTGKALLICNSTKS